MLTAGSCPQARGAAAPAAGATGHSSGSSTGASTPSPGTGRRHQRITSSMACAATNSGSTCSACEGTLNHSRRRWMVMAKSSAPCRPARAGPAGRSGARPCTGQTQKPHPYPRAGAGARSRTPAPGPGIRQPGRAAQRQHVQQQRHQQAAPDEQRVGGQQQLLPGAHDHGRPPFRRGARGFFGAGRGGNLAGHRFEHHHMPRAQRQASGVQ
jgi:hypothetical protein